MALAYEGVTSACDIPVLTKGGSLRFHSFSHPASAFFPT